MITKIFVIKFEFGYFNRSYEIERATFSSMGQENEAELRRQIFAPYQVNAKLVEAAPKAWLMHCLPAHRGEEITGELLDGERSLVYEQAENRLHAQKAILEKLLLPKTPC